ncbi:uncharacterized protein LOC114517405 isoform X2 [Dendronephthya gigantea]|uniref:uncharacterized protein LOC114517405 isoform X2 n=1 Tax=Dendronephthya gigantea TaxID=151771 RepID=UPI00106BB0E0|nr:uncharacterized protein LOC114517405 isoform X2 [Dendronephthya gigantea]
MNLFIWVAIFTSTFKGFSADSGAAPPTSKPTKEPIIQDKKLPLPSTKNLLWHGACSNRLDAQRYAVGGIMFPKNATASLGNFRGTCVSDPEACLDGLSFELWVWFAENDKQTLSNTKSIILQSGSMKSRGIELSVINKTITFTVYAKSYISESQVEVESFKNWIHLVGVWIKKSHSVQLFAGGVKCSCTQIRRRVTNITDDLDGNLTLGPIAKVRPGFVVLHNLSIWMRAIRDSERQTRLKHPGPKMPLWSDWTNCPSDCKQKRYRNCPGCEVEIVKTRICHDTYICGLRRKWPLNNVSNLSCPNCRNLVASSALILPINSTIILGNFKATCLAEPRRCIDGLTFEIYLWFAEYKSDVQREQRGTILKSGFTLGFRFTARSKIVYFQLFNEACVRECDVRSNDWVHIVGIWFKSSNSLNLFMDKVNNYCNKKCFENAAILKHGSKSDDNASAGDLTLGPIQTDSDGYVIAQNLSIWMRAIKETELDELFTHNIPALPENWEQWSKCVQPNCTTKRRRKCQSDNCTVNIVERKNCGVCKAPPSTCKTPDGKEWNSTQLRLTIQKYCKNLSFSEDWLVILKRNDTTSNFTRTWKDYSNGFDNLDGNHFVGNEKLHQLTRYANFQIMVYFHDPSKSVSKLGTTTCDSFYVFSKDENYSAEFKRCKGPAAHALSYLNGASFSTPDRDNDLNGTEHCAQNDRSGFWYKDCGKVSFTISGENTFVVSYLTENGSRVEMHAIIMMIKPYHKRYHELNLKLRFINESWNNELADNSTHRFFLLAGKIKQNIGEIYRNDSAYTSATIVSFRQGSVIATIILDYLTINGSQIASLLMDLRNGYLNAQMAVSYKYSDLKISGQSDDRPEISDLYNTSSTSFNISWRKLTEMTGIRGYKIYYTTIETAAHWSESDVTSNQSETTITNLKMFTVYFVCVLAYSNNMTTLPSQIHNVTTDESVPEVAPNDITVYWNKTDSTVLVTWAHIPRPLIRGYLSHYVITYSNSTSNFTQTSPTNSSVITRLALFTHYRITVAAATRIGVGPSRNISYRTRGIPLLAPTNLTAAGTTGGGITVSWISIPDDVRYDEVIGYRVYYYDQAELRNTTLSVHQTNFTINDVKVNVNYDFTVCGLSAGEREGRRAYTSIIIWNVTVPKMPPKNLTCPGSSPYTISVGWYEYTAAQTGGSLKNYILWYHAKGNPSEEKNITLRPYPPWYTLENLRNSTEYKITVFVYNEKGFSPSANITCKTKEGRPTTRLQLLHVNSSVGENIIPLTWQQSQGKVRGYKVLYQKVSEAGSKVKDASNMKVKRFSADKTSGYVGGLTSFSKYCFKILVFNEYFDGPSSNFKCAETCRCPRIIFTNWFVVDPYVISSNSGIFPTLVKRMISGACGYCETYNNGTTIVHFQKDGNRKRAQKRTSKQVQLEKISNETQISFPVVGPKTGSTGNAGCFMPIIKSPSSVFITRKPVMSTVSQLVIGKALVGTLPLLAFTFVMLLLGAILIWAVEHPNNYDTIPKPFFQGVKQSLWWAYVSVTTVGYGDKVPKSIPGRIFAMIWILYGIALISLVTTGLTTALTATIVVVTKDVKLYGSQVAAVDNSLEFQLGLLKGARMNQKKNFSNVISVLEAVENGDVDGGLVDRLTAARLDKLHEPNSVLVIKDIIEKQSTYGVFVSGKATKLCQKFQQYLRNNANFVTEKVKEFSEPLKKGQVSSSGSQGNWTASGTPSEELIISASSPVFLPLLLWLLGVLFFVIMVALAWHFLYFKHVFAAAKKNKVIPLNHRKEDISSLQQFLTEFRDEAQRKVREIKVRHVRELKTIYKLKTG